MSKSIWNPADCPEWCKAGTADFPCRGEHMRLSSGRAWVPATGGTFKNLGDEALPSKAICAGLYWAEAWGGGIEISLSLDEDGQVDLKIGEAVRLTRELVLLLEAVAFEGTLFEDGEVLEEIASTASEAVAFVKARRAS